MFAIAVGGGLDGGGDRNLFEGRHARHGAGDPHVNRCHVVEGLLGQGNAVAGYLGGVVALADAVEDVARGGEGVGGDDLGAGADIVLVDFAHQVGVVDVGAAAPHVAVHGQALAFHLGADAAIHDDGLAVGQSFFKGRHESPPEPTGRS